MFPEHFRLNSAQPAPVQLPSKFKTDQMKPIQRGVDNSGNCALGSSLIAKLGGEL